MTAEGNAHSAAELELLRIQRAQLASRLRWPWWYVAATFVAWGVAFAMPIASHYLVGAGAWCALLAIVVLYVAQFALARASGVDVGTRTWRYPSGRVWTVALIVVILAGTGMEAFVFDHGSLAGAISVAVIATPAGSACWIGHLRGVRRDLETGSGVRWQ